MWSLKKKHFQAVHWKNQNACICACPVLIIVTFVIKWMYKCNVLHIFKGKEFLEISVFNPIMLSMYNTQQKKHPILCAKFSICIHYTKEDNKTLLLSPLWNFFSSHAIFNANLPCPYKAILSTNGLISYQNINNAMSTCALTVNSSIIQMRMARRSRMSALISRKR